MNDWFTTEVIDNDTFAISEYRHHEETHSYLLNGKKHSLLIDTGLGIADISSEVKKLTKNPIIVAATHIHWDHIGGHRYFSDICVHKAEIEWLTKGFPLPLSLVKKYVSDCELPKGFCIERYTLFQGKPTRILRDGETIDLGGREISVLHTPGHSPGHMCFWEKEKGYLFTGDLVYHGVLFGNFPSTNPEDYFDSLKKIAVLPVCRVLPAHHSLNIAADMPQRVREAFFSLQQAGNLHHGGGTYDFGDFSVLL